MIFDNRYEQTSLENLVHCSTELITTLDQFYTPVEEMRWYLFQTEDMPNTVEDYIDRKIRRMEKLLATLNLYLDAELGIQSETSSEVIPSEHQELSLADDFAINFQDDTPQE
jgi:hypothetical protein